MRETLKEYGKYFIGIAIIVYLILGLAYKEMEFWDKFDYSITITLFISLLYSQFLWKYNPFEKTPKLYGKYEAQLVSTYDKKKRKMKFEIKQDLLSTRVYIKTKESQSESITSSLRKKQDSWQLIYTYENIPNSKERNHSEIHFGTCTLNIVNNQIKNGFYYTDRKTTGDIKNITFIKR